MSNYQNKRTNRSTMNDPFQEFTLIELTDAYEYFSFIKDHEACSLIAKAFVEKPSSAIQNFM